MSIYKAEATSTHEHFKDKVVKHEFFSPADSHCGWHFFRILQSVRYNHKKFFQFLNLIEFCRIRNPRWLVRRPWVGDLAILARTRSSPFRPSWRPSRRRWRLWGSRRLETQRKLGFVSNSNELDIIIISVLIYLRSWSWSTRCLGSKLEVTFFSNLLDKMKCYHKIPFSKTGAMMHMMMGTKTDTKRETMMFVLRHQFYWLVNK